MRWRVTLLHELNEGASSDGEVPWFSDRANMHAPQIRVTQAIELMRSRSGAIAGMVTALVITLLVPFGSAAVRRTATPREIFHDLASAVTCLSLWMLIHRLLYRHNACLDGCGARIPAIVHQLTGASLTLLALACVWCMAVHGVAELIICIGSALLSQAVGIFSKTRRRASGDGSVMIEVVLGTIVVWAFGVSLIHGTRGDELFVGHVVVGAVLFHAGFYTCELLHDGTPVKGSEEPCSQALEEVADDNY